MINIFQVRRVDKVDTWILVHIEIQSQEKSDFAKRMYVYNYRAFDLDERPVISLAILGDERKNWRPSSFGYSLAGCKASIEFPVVKLIDYEAQWSLLESLTNPIAVIVMAHLKTLSTNSQLTEREKWKWQLVRGLYEKGYQREDIIKIFQLIDRMMTLPVELQQRFNQKLINYEEERKMPLISTIEEMAIERGIEMGRSAGIEQGIEQGMLRNLQTNIISLLQRRFETVPPSLIETINSTDNIPLLQNLLLETINVNSITDFQQLLATQEN